MPIFDDFLRMFEDETPTDVSDDDVRGFIESELKIIDKDTNRVIPFRFNAIQEQYWRERTPSDYILKYRKGGFSTLTMAEYFARAVLLENQQVVFLAHREESTHLIFQTMHRFEQNLSPRWKEMLHGGRKSAQVRSKNELRFPNGSQIIAMSGASPDALRGLTPTMVHVSELAFWKSEWVDESFSSILGSLPPTGLIRVETTPSGAGSFAYEEWHHALDHDSRFKPFFYAWWDDPTNRVKEAVTWDELTPLSEDEGKLIRVFRLTPPQIAWRRDRRKEQKQKFKREYPEDSESCWSRSGSTVFDMEQVLACFGGHEPQIEQEQGFTIFQDPQPGHSYVIGVDPAGGNEQGDFSAMIGIDEETGEEVFEFYDRIPIHEFAERAYEVGMRYGEAMLAVERNNHGFAVLQYLTLTKPYPYLYEDDDGKLGIMTTAKSKNIMISKVNEYLWDGDLALKGRTLYRHLSGYAYDDRQRAGATGNGHDDLVSALLCAVFGMSRLHPKSKEEIKETPRPPLPRQPALDTDNAMEWAMSAFHQQIGFAGSVGNTKKMGCPHCGYPDSRLINGIWTCERCGEGVGAYAGF